MEKLAENMGISDRQGINLGDRFRQFCQNWPAVLDPPEGGESADHERVPRKCLDGLRQMAQEFSKSRPSEKTRGDLIYRVSMSLIGRVRLPVMDSFVAQWDALHEWCEKYAHHGYHQGVDEQEVRDKVQQVEDLLSALAVAPPALEEMREVDVLLGEVKGAPTPSQVNRAVSILQNALNPTTHEYFWQQLRAPGWIPLLHKHGFFSKPLPAVREGTRIGFPRWHESEYLVRMASIAPELVVPVAEQIPYTDNERILIDIVEIAGKVPGSMRDPLVKKIINWIRKTLFLHMLLGGDIAPLVVEECKDGRPERAMELAKKVFSIQRDADSDESERRSMGAKLRIHTSEYAPALHACLGALLAAKPEKTLKWLCALLKAAAEVSHPVSEDPTSNSFIWCVDFAQDPRPWQQDDIERVLVTAVRDAAEHLIENGHSEALTIIERYQWILFRRIGLHLRARFENLDPAGTECLISHPHWLEQNRLFCPEWTRFLRNRFHTVSGAARSSYVAFAKGDPSAWSYIASSGSEDAISELKLTDPARIAMERAYTYLNPVRQYLDAETNDLLESIEQAFPERLRLAEVQKLDEGWVGPKSPLADESLATMTVDDVLAFLSIFRPVGDSLSPSREGLGRVLRKTVAARGIEFSAVASSFCLDEPTYVRAFVEGLTDAVEAGIGIAWAPVLATCHWTLDKPRQIDGREPLGWEEDPGWWWCWQSIPSLLRRGLAASGEAAIPLSLRDRVWAILSELVEDPDPTPLTEQDRLSTDGAFTLAINTVRGVAMHAVIAYVWWLARHKSEDGTADPAEDSALLAVLDRHLDMAHDPSAAIRSVYGKYFTLMHTLLPEWAQRNVDSIFPPNAADRTQWEAAWDAYVSFCNPSPELFRTLERHYALAIERMGERQAPPLFAKPDERLAHHLLDLYYGGMCPLAPDRELFGAYLERASTELRSRVLSWAGNLPGDATPKIVARAREFWERYRSTIKAPIDSTDAAGSSAFCGWFASPAFEPAWALAQLSDVLGSVKSVKLSKPFFDRLAALADCHLSECVKCLQLALRREDQSRPGLVEYICRDSIASVLTAGLHAEDIETQGRVRKTVDWLLARWPSSFQNLRTED
jgi:hypothetical protein